MSKGTTANTGTLFVIATPIGNLEDVTHRALRVLSEVDALACEDTRRTRRLLEHYEIDRPETVFSYHEHNEARAVDGILNLLEQGRNVAVCTNAGYPGISDPGYRIVSAARERDIRVSVLPGAGAVEAALLASGLSTATYTFKGFAPKKSGRRRRFLEEERGRPQTLVFFESPYRVGKLLAAAREVLGDRLAAVCIELTKKFERVHRGYLADLSAQFADRQVKGEITVVIAGNHPKFRRDEGPDA
ncbi:MAG: 16S rRNA (cytidine(1402)-2'-O)-methyltransferase [Planctomycetota bacterium]